MATQHCTVSVKPLAFTALVFAAALWGHPADTRADDEDPALQQEREARLKFMRQLAEACVLSSADDPEVSYRLTSQPVIRYSNPVRNFMSDGATFFWLDGERPVAVASFSIRGNGNVFREFTSLAAQPMICHRDENVIWSPVGGGLLHQAFPESPRVAASQPLRLTQMRRLAEMFSAAYTDPRTGETNVLRLLSQPLYRYADDAAGVLDAAVFGLAEANDPECLLIIEAVTPDSEDQRASWRFSLARMSSVPMSVDLEDREIWTVKGYWRNPRSLDDPYREAADGKYPRESAP